MLVAGMPELGWMTAGEATAMAGLAPVPHDSRAMRSRRAVAVRTTRNTTRPLPSCTCRRMPQPGAQASDKTTESARQAALHRKRTQVDHHRKRDPQNRRSIAASGRLINIIVRALHRRASQSVDQGIRAVGSDPYFTIEDDGNRICGHALQRHRCQKLCPHRIQFSHVAQLADRCQTQRPVTQRHERSVRAKPCGTSKMARPKMRAERTAPRLAPATTRNQSNPPPSACSRGGNADPIVGAPANGPITRSQPRTNNVAINFSAGG